MKKYFCLALFLCAVFVITACSGDKKTQQAPPPPLVTIITVEAKDHPYPAEYQAVTQGSKAVEIRARVEAIIQKRLYTEGEFVQEGQMLFQLERDQYEARFQDAKAQLDRAKREWDRVRPLYEKNAVSQKERDNARAAFETAQANLRSAEINLGYCQVVAPVAGYTGKENFTAGNLVSNNSLLTSLNQANPLYVNFAIPAPEIMRRQQMALEGRMILPEGSIYKAQIRLVDGTMYATQGEVTFIDTQVDQTTGVVKARAEFPNEHGVVLPGQYVRIYLLGAILHNAILIPQKCVLLTQKGSLVMVVDAQNVVQVRPVQISIMVGNMYLVEKGLAAGDRVILEGLVKARPGLPVRVEDAKPAQATQAGGPQDKPNAGQSK